MAKYESFFREVKSLVPGQNGKLDNLINRIGKSEQYAGPAELVKMATELSKKVYEHPFSVTEICYILLRIHTYMPIKMVEDFCLTVINNSVKPEHLSQVRLVCENHMGICTDHDHFLFKEIDKAIEKYRDNFDLAVLIKGSIDSNFQISLWLEKVNYTNLTRDQCFSFLKNDWISIPNIIYKDLIRILDLENQTCFTNFKALVLSQKITKDWDKVTDKICRETIKRIARIANGANLLARSYSNYSYLENSRENLEAGDAILKKLCDMDPELQTLQILQNAGVFQSLEDLEQQLPSNLSLSEIGNNPLFLYQIDEYEIFQIEELRRSRLYDLYLLYREKVRS